MTSTPLPPRNSEVIFYEEELFPCIGLARERCKMHGNMAGYQFYQRLHEEILLVLQRDGEYPALSAHQFEKVHSQKEKSCP